ncbi:hypothetical protein [Cellulomonas sp. ATA003]|uniref:hypothetical protein n=1 Tax=Cellulomonas sp. ATA003 TaxID=3073064 RepID=UPI002873115B|nr:hypothetical protein [Cellulomonas sp. ATA003]WNB84854.1 hypothetical protein REH70_14065 [Cellulomonas sp. ATA003]
MSAAREDLTGRRVVVAGHGVTGRAAAAVLRAQGAVVVTVDARDPEADVADAAAFLADDGLADADLVVASPGWAPGTPLLAAARDRGLPVWSEVELAWRLRADRTPGPTAPTAAPPRGSW